MLTEKMVQDQSHLRYFNMKLQPEFMNYVWM